MSSEAEGHSYSLERSLQWTLGILVVLVLLALTGSALWIGRAGTEQFVASRLAHDAEALIAGLDLQSGEVGDPLPPVYSQPFSGHYYWVRLDGGLLRRSRSLWDYPLEVTALPPGETALGIFDGPQDQRLLLWRAGFEKQGVGFTVAVAEDLTPLLGTLRLLLWVGVGLSLLGTLTLLLVQRWLLRRGFKQVAAVRSDLRRLEAGEIDRLREDVPEEIGPLVRELNQFIDAWRRHLQRSRKALGNLAHALKSPLNLILLHHGETRDDPVAEQAARIRELIDRELRRARLAGEGTPGRRFRPHEEIPDLVAGVRALYRDKPLEISIDMDTPERLPFDEEDMLELLGNLLDNAAKWARRRIYLSLRWGKGVQILVEDDGPGVEPDASECLSARGSRLDESTPGHGLGLSIVREIVRVHGGQVRFARSEKLGGFSANIELCGISEWKNTGTIAN
jgi:signal transduction histidine kinase